MTDTRDQFHERESQVAPPVRSGEFTPGPWVVERDGKQWAVKRPGLRAIYMMRKTKEAAQKACGEANARYHSDLLHDAAPDLLKALKMARECIAYCRRAHKDAQTGEGVPVEVFLDFAINKAEGRS